MPGPRHALALASLCALMLVWGSTYVITQLLVQDLSPLLLTALRFVVASAVLVPWAWARGGLGRLARPVPIGALLWMALTGYLLYYLCFNYALRYTPAVEGALIQAASPAAVALAAVLLLGERLGRLRIVGLVSSIGGVAIVLLAGSGPASGLGRDPPLGAALMAGSVVVWALYTLTAKRLAEEDTLIVTSCVSLIATVALLGPAAWQIHGHGWPAIPVGGWLAIVYLGAVCTAGGFLLYSWALRTVDASVAGIYINLAPVVGVLSAVLFLGQTLRPLQILGAVIALGGTWLSS